MRNSLLKSTKADSLFCIPRFGLFWDLLQVAIIHAERTKISPAIKTLSDSGGSLS